MSPHSRARWPPRAPSSYATALSPEEMSPHSRARWPPRPPPPIVTPLPSHLRKCLHTPERDGHPGPPIVTPLSFHPRKCLHTPERDGHPGPPSSYATALSPEEMSPHSRARWPPSPPLVTPLPSHLRKCVHTPERDGHPGPPSHSYATALSPEEMSPHSRARWPPSPPPLVTPLPSHLRKCVHTPERDGHPGPPSHSYATALSPEEMSPHSRARWPPRAPLVTPLPSHLRKCLHTPERDGHPAPPL